MRYYNVSSPGIIEFLFTVCLTIVTPWLIPLLFLFKDRDNENQMVAIRPDRLNWAKFWMIVTFGGMWFYWRYVGKVCDECGCSWSIEALHRNEHDRYDEAYTTTEIRVSNTYDGPIGSGSGMPSFTTETEVPVTKYRQVITYNAVSHCTHCGSTFENIEF